MMCLAKQKKKKKKKKEEEEEKEKKKLRKRTLMALAERKLRVTGGPPARLCN